MLKAGDKVTIWENCKHETSIPVGITRVESVGARVVKTKDGRRWNTKRNREVDERGSEISTRSIESYADGDDKRIAREKRLAGARNLLKGHEWEVSRDFGLLSDEDLETLGAIARRLNDARKAQDAQEDEA